MNVLLIGGCSNVINNLIIKLNKEGHRIYLLTGSRYEKQPYQRVFEKYHFPYDAGCLNEIFESINPDLTIFMGAYDTNFHWDNEESEAVRYSACVMNILMAYAMKNKGRFIYPSSDEVYQGDFPEDISERLRRPRALRAWCFPRRRKCAKATAKTAAGILLFCVLTICILCRIPWQMSPISVQRCVWSL